MGNRRCNWLKAGLVATLATATIYAGELELQPATLKCWTDYEHAAVAAMQKRVRGEGCFLRVNRDPDRTARLRAGEILVWPAAEANPRRVPSGLIHDWIGAAFVPNARIADILAVARDYGRYKDIYKPGVLDAHLLRQNGGDDQFTMVLRNPSFFTSTALQGEFASTYTKLDDTRWYSTTQVVHLQEIDGYGQTDARKLAPDCGHGYIWRLTSLSTMEEKDGGVYVEEEVLALSRDVPTALRWMAGPIIRHEARESTAISIARTRAAVGSGATDYSVSKRPPVPQGVTSSLLSRP